MKSVRPIIIILGSSSWARSNFSLFFWGIESAPKISDSVKNVEIVRVNKRFILEIPP